MRIWRLSQRCDARDLRDGWNIAVVLRAVSEAAARVLAAQVNGSEPSEFWLDPERTDCLEVPVHGEEEVLLVSQEVR
jgi:hypothetical protein